MNIFNFMNEYLSSLVHVWLLYKDMQLGRN